MSLALHNAFLFYWAVTCLLRPADLSNFGRCVCRLLSMLISVKFLGLTSRSALPTVSYSSGCTFSIIPQFLLRHLAYLWGVDSNWLCPLLLWASGVSVRRQTWNLTLKSKCRKVVAFFWMSFLFLEHEIQLWAVAAYVYVLYKYI